MNTRPHTLALLVLASGMAACTSEHGGVELLVPADVEFTWDGAYNDTVDGLAAILPLDVMVYDAVTGEPVAGAAVELSSDHAAFVLAEDVWSGEAGCIDCMWDAYRDEYVELAPDAAASPFLAHTDAVGLARVYAVVDAVPERAQGFDAVQVRAVFDAQERFVALVPR